jgi:5-methylcytosine-specific restriction endonuclease McrA
VIVPRRGFLSKAAKVAIWNAQNGICPRCLKPVPQEGLGVQYDHDVPREISADDSLGNLFALHTACHAEKTAKEDAPTIAKTHRQEKLTRPKERNPGGFKGWRNMRGEIVWRDQS